MKERKSSTSNYWLNTIYIKNLSIEIIIYVVPLTEEFMIGTCEGKIVTFKKMKMFESFTLN